MFGGKIEINQINCRKENHQRKTQDEMEIGRDKKKLGKIREDA